MIHYTQGNTHAKDKLLTTLALATIWSPSVMFLYQVLFNIWLPNQFMATIER